MARQTSEKLPVVALRGSGVCNLSHGAVLHGQLYAVHCNKLLILLDNRVFGLCENVDKRV